MTPLTSLNLNGSALKIIHFPFLFYKHHLPDRNRRYNRDIRHICGMSFLVVE